MKLVKMKKYIDGRGSYYPGAAMVVSKKKKKKNKIK